MLREGDTPLRGHNVTGTECYVEGKQRNGDIFVTGTCLYGLGTNLTTRGHCVTPWGQHVTGMGKQCYGGHNVTRPFCDVTRPIYDTKGIIIAEAKVSIQKCGKIGTLCTL